MSVTKRTRLAAFFVIALSIGAHLNGLPNEFTFDDHIVVVDNEKLDSLGQVGEIFTSSGWHHGVSGNLYRPVTLFTFALNKAVSPSPGGFRAVNILLHAVASLLLLIIALKWLPRFGAAVCAASMFAVHPVHVEAVTSIVGRAELLAASFGLGSLWVLLKATENRSPKLPVVAGALYLCALLSKEIAVPFFAVLVVSVWLHNRPSAVRLLIPCVVALVIYFALRTVALGALIQGESAYVLTPIDNSLATLEGSERVATAVSLFGRYLHLLLVPIHLSADYSIATVLPGQFADLRVVLSLLLLLAGVAATIRATLMGQASALGWIAFFAPYVLISNVPFLIGTTMAERLLYLPSVGFCLLAGGLFGRYLPDESSSRTRAHVLAFIVLVLLVGAYGVRTVTRNTDWRNDEVLYASSLKTSPRSTKLMTALAAIKHQQGDVDAAIRLTRDALEVYPQNPKARFYLANMLIAQKHDGEATSVLEEGVSHSPDELPFWRKLTSLYQRSGRFDDMHRAATRTVELDPRELTGYMMLSLACVRLERFRDAEQHLLDATRIDPTHHRPHEMLATLYSGPLSQPRKAEYHRGVARNLKPKGTRTP